MGPLPPGISGVAALNPALATMMQGNPMLAGMMHGAINGAEVPFQEGWLKLRGIPFTVTKPDIVRFFEVRLPQRSCTAFPLSSSPRTLTRQCLHNWR